ncbi:MAG TPA: ABC transporter substrate-binding protein [Stellaceae bacterium]|nr:ABC transporter substrate-binding protein [Stellaceae bacterium]
MHNNARHLRLWLAIAAIACIAGEADAATTIRVGNSSATAFNFMPLALGIERGTFAKNGLDVQVVDLGGASKIYQAMIAGSIDMSLAAGTDIPFIMKGVPETGVGAIAITPALLGIVVPWNSPIHSLADLKGKKVGFSTVGSLTQWVAFAAVHKAGLTPNDITGVTDGSTTAPQIAALETGQVDAQVSAVALGWNLEQQKKGRLLASASDFVGPFLLNAIYARDDFIKQHPDAVRGFLKGWYETVNFMATHRAETVQFEKSIDKFSDTVNEKQYDMVMPSLSRDGKFPPDALAATARSMVDLGMLKTEPDMMKFLTTRFLPPSR